jgi:hypothetical protein
MAFIFNRPQDEIVPLETLLRIRLEAAARTKGQLDTNISQLKVINKRLERLLGLLQEIEESQE